MRSPTMLFGTVACLAGAGAFSPAAAQTAYEINRLNQAIQVCNSPAGPTIPECAKLRGQLGTAPAVPAAGGTSAGTSAAGLAGLLGQAINARRTVPEPAPAANTAALQQSVAGCVQRAAGNEAAIQACLASASRPSAPGSSFATSPAAASPFAQRPAAPSGTAGGIYGAGQSYQACVAADQANWRRCLPLLNGGRPAQ